MKKSYHSMLVPTALASATRRDSDGDVTLLSRLVEHHQKREARVVGSRSPRVCRQWICVIAVIAVVGNVRLGAQESPSEAAQSEKYVEIVTAHESSFTFGQLVERVAPVLWFSENEPAQRDGLFPAAILPESSPRRVVYYKARVRLDAPEEGCKRMDSDRYLCDSIDLGPDVRIPTEHVTSAHVLFYFYYKQDYGFGGHRHDLEGLDVELRRQGSALVIASVVGAAHGQGWYSNELRLDKDDELVLPIHALVEEGKHATAPDRNADGIYSPRYDVTHYPNDAWGIRDAMSGRYLPGNRFDATMAKRRLERMMVWPPGQGPAASRYELRSSFASGVCDTEKGRPLVND